MIALSARDTALAALGAAYVAGHAGYPGPDGSANEMTNMGYSRVAEGFTAFGGVLSLDAPVALNVDGDFDWLSAWDAGTAGNICGICPLGGFGKRYCVDPSTDVFFLPAHGYANDQAVVFYGDAAPAGLTAGVVMYVRDAGTHIFKVTDVISDPPIDITDFPGSPLALVSNYNVDSAAVERDVNINVFAFSLNG